MALYTQIQGSPFFIFEAPGDGGTIVLTNGAPVSGVNNASGVWGGSGIVGDPDGPVGGNDLIILNGNAQGTGDGPIEVNGLSGNDTVRLNGLFTGGFGRGGAGNDFLTWVNIVSASIRGGGGDDIVEAGAAAGTNASKVNGNEGNDLVIMRGNVGNSLIAGGGGNDTVRMLTGADSVTTTTVNGGGGNDLITDGGLALTGVGNWSGSTINGDDGTDTLDFSSSNKVANAANLTLTGGAGNDSIVGGGGDDIIDGGAGTDIIDGLRGSDTLTGGSEADRFRFGNFAFTDVITDFQTGVDKIVLDIGRFPNGAPVPSSGTNFAAQAPAGSFQFSPFGRVGINYMSAAATAFDVGGGVVTRTVARSFPNGTNSNGLLLFTRGNQNNVGAWTLANPSLASGGAVNYGNRSRYAPNNTTNAGPAENQNYLLWSGNNLADVEANIERGLVGFAINFSFMGLSLTGFAPSQMVTLNAASLLRTVGFAVGRDSANGGLHLFRITAPSIGGSLVTTVTANSMGVLFAAGGAPTMATAMGFLAATRNLTMVGTAARDLDIGRLNAVHVATIVNSNLPFVGTDILMF